jgi:hypothetical protein
MFFSKPKSFLGIDFGAGGVKLVELKQEKNRPVLFTWDITRDIVVTGTLSAEIISQIIPSISHYIPNVQELWFNVKPFYYWIIRDRVDRIRELGYNVG